MATDESDVTALHGQPVEVVIVMFPVPPVYGTVMELWLTPYVHALSLKFAAWTLVSSIALVVSSVTVPAKVVVSGKFLFGVEKIGRRPHGVAESHA